MTDFTYSENELQECAAGRKLLSIGLELTHRCNLRCIYCYSDAGSPLPYELSFNELTDIITQSTELGARKVGIIGGGEPLLYKDIIKLISFIKDKMLSASVFTNGQSMTRNLAEFLFKNNVSVVQKLNSLKEPIQDYLAGRKGAYSAISQSVKYLMDAGYPNDSAKLSIETVVLPENIDEIPSIWVWARDRDITPIVEMLTPQGRALSLETTCDTEAIRRLYERLSQIDSSKYGIDWVPKPPIAGVRGCWHHLYTLYIRSDGDVQPCSGIGISLGSTRSQSLASILSESDILHQLRNIRTNIKGKCKSCSMRSSCYGCRAAAFLIHGDYLAEDPFCWHEDSGHSKSEKATP